MHPNSIDDGLQETASTATLAPPEPRLEVQGLLKRYYDGQQHLRRGICLLNAGEYAQAAEEFTAASRANPHSRSLPRLLAACHIGGGRFDLAAANMQEAISVEPKDVTARVRHALTLWKDHRGSEAINHLRAAIAEHPESAELHFQLGTLLAALDELAEAEMRFTQAIAIDKNHSDALVSLALCCAVDRRVGEAQRYLERAQRRRPHDARIGLLLTQAARSLADQGTPVSLHAEIPTAPSNGYGEAIEHLSRIVAAEPDFIDAFLTLPSADVDADTYAMLAETLNRALDFCPQDAALHSARGRVLVRLGRADEAILATERALDLDPRSVQALVQLAELYQQTNRHDDARDRLERALALGAEFADVYYLLGNLYRHGGQIERARWAYGQALRINDHYEAARTALDSLAA